MPKLLSALSAIGTVAMLWVGGHILLVGTDDVGWHAPYGLVHHAEDFVHHAVQGVGGVLAWLVNTAASAVIGLVVGAVVVAIMHVLAVRAAARDTTRSPRWRGTASSDVCATSRIGPSSADTHAAAPRSSVTAVDLACTTVEPSVHSRICGPSWRVGRVDLVAKLLAVDTQHRHRELRRRRVVDEFHSVPGDLGRSDILGRRA